MVGIRQKMIGNIRSLYRELPHYFYDDFEVYIHLPSYPNTSHKVESSQQQQAHPASKE